MCILFIRYKYAWVESKLTIGKIGICNLLALCVCSVPDKTVTINCAANVFNICDVLICFCFLFFSYSALAPVLCLSFCWWRYHSDVCIQPAAFGDKEPAGCPASLRASLRWLLLCTKCGRWAGVGGFCCRKWYPTMLC